MLLFIYGTMKAGGSNRALLLQQEPVFIGEFHTRDRFALYIRRNDDLPIAVRGEAVDDPLRGELHEIADERVIAHLDPFEGHPDLYRREPVTLSGFNEAGDPTVWIYVFRQPVTAGDRRILPIDGLLRYDP